MAWFKVTVKVSSYLIVVGAGAYICYQFVLPSRIRAAQCLTFLSKSGIASFRCSKTQKLAVEPSKSSPLALKPEVTNEANSPNNNEKPIKDPSTPKPSPSSPPQDPSETSLLPPGLEVSNLESSHEISYMIDNLVNSKSFSLSCSTDLGQGTVAKLNQLIDQAKDLRESVGEINADFVNVRRGTHFPGVNSSVSSLSSSSFSPKTDSIIETTLEKTCGNSPSLEWDQNGMHLLSDDSEISIDNSSVYSVNLESSQRSFHLTSDDSGNSSRSLQEAEVSQLDCSGFQDESKVRIGKNLVSISTNSSFNLSALGEI